MKFFKCIFQGSQSLLITPRILMAELDLTRLGWLVNSTWRLLGLYLPVCVYQINVTYRSHAKYRQMLGPSHIYMYPRVCACSSGPRRFSCGRLLTRPKQNCGLCSANGQHPTTNSQRKTACRPYQLAPIKCLINAQRICAALMLPLQVDRQMEVQLAAQRAYTCNLFKIFIKKVTK